MEEANTGMSATGGIIIGGTATVTVVANFAWQHLKAATLFRDQVLRIEFENMDKPLAAFYEEIRSYGSACIMSTAASLEALINELFIAPGLALRPQIPDFATNFWGRGGIEMKPILEKYQLALSMIGAKGFDEHTSPYRDIWAIIELRNALVHYKPTWDPDRKRKVELMEVLNGKFHVSPFVDEGADFVSMKCMSGDCSKWVLMTAFKFIREFDSRTNLDPGKMAGFWPLET